MIRKVAPYTDFAGYPAIFFTCSKRFGAKYTRIFFTVYLVFNNCDSCWTICRDSSSDLYNGLHHRWSSFCLGHSQHNGLQCWPLSGRGPGRQINLCHTYSIWMQQLCFVAVFRIQMIRIGSVFSGLPELIRIQISIRSQLEDTGMYLKWILFDIKLRCCSCILPFF